MEIYMYVGWIAWIPTLIIVSIFLYKNILKIRNYYSLKKVEIKTHENYDEIELNKISNPGYRIPKGQIALFKFENVELYRMHRGRVSDGTSNSGIRIPFATLSFSKRRYYDKNFFMKQGAAKVILTNSNIRIQVDENASLIENKINQVEQIRYVDDPKTVYYSQTKRAWPIKLRFATHEDAKLFINSIWTIYNKSIKEIENSVIKNVVENLNNENNIEAKLVNFDLDMSLDYEEENHD